MAVSRVRSPQELLTTMPKIRLTPMMATHEGGPRG